MAETAKNGFKCHKMHSNVYFPKRVTKYQKMAKMAKKVTKYVEKMTNM